MIGSITPILYDFKRAFFRISTLLLLILFILAGIGMSYLVVNSLTQQYPSTNIAAIIVDANGTCVMEGYVYDLAGNPLKAKLTLTDSDGNPLYEVDLNSTFSIRDKKLCSLFKLDEIEGVIESSYGETDVHTRSFYMELKDGGEVGFILLYTGNTGFTILMGGPGPWWMSNQTTPHEVTRIPPSEVEYYKEFIKRVISAENPSGVAIYRLIIVSRSTGKAKLILGVVNFTNMDMMKPDLMIDYSLYKVNMTFESIDNMEINYENLTYNSLGSLRGSYVNVYDLEIDNENNEVILRLRYDNATDYLSMNYALLPAVDTMYVQGLLNFNVGFSLFMQFFPIVFLYLAYVLMAKPRSTGALEFIVARPITRWDLYLTRFLAGVLTAITASALFLIGINLANQVLLGVTLDLYANTLLFLGLIASLISFYALCYMIASSVRSGLYLALSIILYLLFAMFWGLIVMIYSFTVGGGFMSYGENLYKISYFNPLSPGTTYAPYYVQKHYNLTPALGLLTTEEEPVNPIAATIAPIAWTVVCFVVGYMIFKRTNLTS